MPEILTTSDIPNFQTINSWSEGMEVEGLKTIIERAGRPGPGAIYFGKILDAESGEQLWPTQRGNGYSNDRGRGQSSCRNKIKTMCAQILNERMGLTAVVEVVQDEVVQGDFINVLQDVDQSSETPIVEMTEDRVRQIVREEVEAIFSR